MTSLINRTSLNRVHLSLIINLYDSDNFCYIIESISHHINKNYIGDMMHYNILTNNRRYIIVANHVRVTTTNFDRKQRKNILRKTILLKDEA